jgi:hypothetical protein
MEETLQCPQNIRRGITQQPQIGRRLPMEDNLKIKIVKYLSNH